LATIEVFMSSKRYTEDFKVEAVKQITDRGHSVAEVAGRLGVSIHSLYAWQRRLDKPTATRHADTDQAAELRRVKSELRRVTEERDILKKAAAYFAKQSG
jgi:transposase